MSERRIMELAMRWVSLGEREQCPRYSDLS